MRLYRVTFVAGLVVGYVLGTRAGRERYEQMTRMATRIAEHPAVQQAAGATQAGATGLVKSACRAAVGGCRAGAARFYRRRTRMHGGEGEGSADDGSGTSSRPFVPADGQHAQRSPD